ncbi:MAG: DUF1905 domain-containing protein [Acidobacteria bacterium]|nr:DUF1905 domain-containing protein [Acidobacteriota bacterium]
MKKTFRGVLEKSGDGLGWTVVRLPFDATAAWKKRNGMRVRGTVNGAAFRTSLFPYKGGGQMLLVNRELQKAAKVKLGSAVDVVIAPDMEERPEAGVPAELGKLLKSDRTLKKFYDKFSPSAKKDIERRIMELKSVESRTRAAEQLAERILLTIDGERELPPILQVVFRRYPGAMEGWKNMTAAQRRGHLLGVFYYQTPEARERRAVKAAEDAVKRARS